MQEEKGTTEDEMAGWHHEKFLYCEGHSERFTALHGEEKREEGVRGDPNEMRWNQ